MKQVFWKRVFPLVLAVSIYQAFSPPLFARKPGDGYPGLMPIAGSEAYKRYETRPKTDLSKLLYLLDRFEKANLIIIYNGYRYTTAFGANFGRWFVTRYYRNQTANEWILQWCNRAVPSGDLIWVELPDKSVRLGREVLQEELMALARVETVPPAQEKNPTSPKPPALEKTEMNAVPFKQEAATQQTDTPAVLRDQEQQQGESRTSRVLPLTDARTEMPPPSAAIPSAVVATKTIEKK